MNALKNFIKLALILLLAGCSDSHKHKYKYIAVDDNVMSTFNDDSFEDTRHLSHSVIDDDFIGKPVRISVIDSFLYVVDSSPAMDSIVHLFDIKNKTYKGPVISRGVGPNELYSIGEISSSADDKTVWGNDIRTRRWLGIDKEILIQTKRCVVKKKMQFHKTMIYVNDPVWISDTTFMALDFESYKERFYILNDDLNCSPVYNPYFHFNKNISKPIMSDIFSTFTSVKADKSKIVLAGRYFDCLEIYDTDGICLKIVKGPNKNFTIKYDELKSDEKNRFVKSGETKRAYLSVKSTNSRIYALYSGKKHRYSTDLIYVFDWDGNPLAKYKLDCIIAGFDVEMDNQTIYAIKEDDLSIIRFDISNENLK